MSEKFNQESEQHRADDEQLARAREILDEAKKVGEIEWTENTEEFVLKFKEREIHVPKWAKTPIMNNVSGETSSAPLERVIKAFLVNPEAGEKGELRKTIGGIDKKEDSDNINS